MNLKERIRVIVALGDYLRTGDESLDAVKEKAQQKNGWFTRHFIDLAFENIATGFLSEERLLSWVALYHLDDNIVPKTVGVVMAGNIPLVGFHDFLCVFISGHYQRIKLSEKDDVLFPFLLGKMKEWNVTIGNAVAIAEQLKGCDAYIATGSNNSARYFNYYFGRYPSVIRQNKTSAAVLSGDETAKELRALSDDIHIYFGLGCRNVTSMAVPKDYNFEPLLAAFEKYDYFFDHNKFKNNYDYILALLMMNRQKYMSAKSKILVESNHPFAPVSQLNYSYYDDYEKALYSITANKEIQCVVARDASPFGSSQSPTLIQYADGKDVMQFLLTL